MWGMKGPLPVLASQTPNPSTLFPNKGQTVRTYALDNMAMGNLPSRHHTSLL